MEKKRNYSALSDVNLLRAYVFNPKNIEIVEELNRRHLTAVAEKLRRATSVFVQKEAQLILDVASNKAKRYSLKYTVKEG